MYLRKSLILSSMLLAIPSQAAQQVEEITVTADFIIGSINQLSGSLSVVDSDILNRQAPQHIDSLLDSLVNVSLSSAGSRSRFMQVRGVGDLEQFQDPKNYPSVVVTLNGAELGDAAAALLFDIDQLELARGPQATSQGAVGHAGALSLNSTSAASDNRYVQLGLGSDGLWQAGLAAGTRIEGVGNDGLDLRLALYSSSEDGQIKNRYLNRDDTAGRDEQLLRLTGRLQPEPLTDISFTAQWVEADNGYDAWSLDDERTTVSDQPGSDDLSHALLSVNVAHTHYSGAISEIILSHSQSDSDYGYDADWVNMDFPGVFTASERFLRDKEFTSLDLRWNSPQSESSQFVAGLYLRDAQENLDYFDTYGYVSTGDYSSEQQAIYGQWLFRSGRSEWIVAGRLEYFSDQYMDTLDFSSNDEDWLRHFSIIFNWRPSEQSLIYAKLAQSEKPGGINTSTSAQFGDMAPHFKEFIADRLIFNSENLRSFEVGTKWQNSSTQLRSTFFYNQRKNAQLESWMYDVSNYAWIGYLDSTADSENYGVELEWQQSLSKELSSYVNLGFLQTEVDSITSFDLDLSDFAETKNRDQAKSPRYQYSTGLRYQRDQSSLELQLQGADSSYYGYYHDGKLPGYHLINLFVNTRIAGVQWSLWGRNLADRDYAVHGLYFENDPRYNWTNVNESYRQLAPGRSIGISGQYQF